MWIGILAGLAAFFCPILIGVLLFLFFRRRAR
jgi:hypothetical protein